MSKIPARSFTTAGTKDRRAITTQRVSVQKIKIPRIEGLNKVLHGCSVGNYSYNMQGLNLGDLTGNHFKIAMRHVDGSQETIKTAMESLKTRGFINYCIHLLI